MFATWKIARCHGQNRPAISTWQGPITMISGKQGLVEFRNPFDKPTDFSLQALGGGGWWWIFLVALKQNWCQLLWTYTDILYNDIYVYTLYIIHYTLSTTHYTSGGWFGTCEIFFHNIWDNPSHWLMFLYIFQRVETTNQWKNEVDSICGIPVWKQRFLCFCPKLVWLRYCFALNIGRPDGYFLESPIDSIKEFAFEVFPRTIE